MPEDQRRFWETDGRLWDERDDGSSDGSDRSSNQSNTAPSFRTASDRTADKKHITVSTMTPANTGGGIRMSPSPSPTSNHSTLTSTSTPTASSASSSVTAPGIAAAYPYPHSYPSMDPVTSYQPRNDPLVQIDPACFPPNTPSDSIVILKHNPNGNIHRFQRPNEAPLHLWPHNAAKLELKRWMPPASVECDRWNTAMFYKTDEETDSKGRGRGKLGYGVEGSDERAVWHAFMYTRDDLVCDIAQRMGLPTIIVDWLSPDIDTLQYPNHRVAGPITAFSCLYCMAMQKNGSACTVNGKMMFPKGLAHIKLAAAAEKVRTAKSRLRKEAWPKKMNARCWYRSQHTKGGQDADSLSGSSSNSQGTTIHPPLSRAPRPLTPPNARLPLTPPQTNYTMSDRTDTGHPNTSGLPRAHANMPGTPISPLDHVNPDATPRRSPTMLTSATFRPMAGRSISGPEQGDIDWSGGRSAPQTRRPGRIDPNIPSQSSASGSRKHAHPHGEDDHYIYRETHRPRYIFGPPHNGYEAVESFLASENRRLRRQRAEAYIQLDEARRYTREQEEEIARLRRHIDMLQFSQRYKQPDEGFGARSTGLRLRRPSRSEEPVRPARDLDESGMGGLAERSAGQRRQEERLRIEPYDHRAARPARGKRDIDELMNNDRRDSRGARDGAEGGDYRHGGQA